MLAVELHSHSSQSYDGHDTIEELLEAARAAGLDALAVTDHDSIEASLDAAALAPEYDLIGIPGIEVSTAAGHVIGLGVETLIPGGLSFRETVDRIHDAGGIVIVPHPFQEFRKGVLNAVPKSELLAADAIEVYNSRLVTGRANRQAERFARAQEMPMTAGSDAHIKEMIGQAPTFVDTDDRSVAGVLDAIRAGKTTVQKRRTPFRITLKQGYESFIRRLREQLLP